MQALGSEQDFGLSLGGLFKVQFTAERHSWLSGVLGAISSVLGASIYLPSTVRLFLVVLLAHASGFERSCIRLVHAEVGEILQNPDAVGVVQLLEEQRGQSHPSILAATASYLSKLLQA